MVINITVNKTFGIHDLLKNYSCYNVFNQEDMNTFNVMTFIQVRTDKTQIRNTDTFSVLMFIQARADKKWIQRVRIYFSQVIFVSF